MPSAGAATISMRPLLQSLPPLPRAVSLLEPRRRRIAIAGAVTGIRRVLVVIVVQVRRRLGVPPGVWFTVCLATGTAVCVAHVLHGRMVVAADTSPRRAVRLVLAPMPSPPPPVMPGVNRVVALLAVKHVIDTRHCRPLGPKRGKIHRPCVFRPERDVGLDGFLPSSARRRR